MKKLFDNQVFSFFFGVIFTLIIGWISWISGESTNVWIFSIIVGLFGVGIKEVVNKFMLEQGSFKNVLFGFIGNIVGGIILCL